MAYVPEQDPMSFAVLSCLAMDRCSCGSVSPSTVRAAPAYSAVWLNGFVRVAQYRPVSDRQTRQPAARGPAVGAIEITRPW